MKNSRWILVFDIESDSPDEKTCNIVELAAIPIEPETLEIKYEQSFSIKIKPPEIDTAEYFTQEREKTIAWHASQRKTTSDEIIASWKQGGDLKFALQQFVKYCEKYNVKKRKGQWFPQPIPAGYNIIGFDIPILSRLLNEYKLPYPLSPVTKLDLMDNLFWWFENLDEPDDFKMDTWRQFFNMPAHSQAHEALSDVIDEAKMIVRFLKFHRKQASVSKFKGSFA